MHSRDRPIPQSISGWVAKDRNDLLETSLHALNSLLQIRDGFLLISGWDLWHIPVSGISVPVQAMGLGEALQWLIVDVPGSWAWHDWPRLWEHRWRYSRTLRSSF